MHRMANVYDYHHHSNDIIPFDGAQRGIGTTFSRRATFRIRGNAEHIATVKIAFTTIKPLAK